MSYRISSESRYFSGWENSTDSVDFYSFHCMDSHTDPLTVNDLWPEDAVLPEGNPGACDTYLSGYNEKEAEIWERTMSEISSRALQPASNTFSVYNVSGEISGALANAQMPPVFAWHGAQDGAAQSRKRAPADAPLSNLPVKRFRARSMNASSSRGQSRALSEKPLKFIPFMPAPAAVPRSCLPLARKRSIEQQIEEKQRPVADMILKVLREAPKPLNCGEIKAACGLDSGSARLFEAALWRLIKSEEIVYNVSDGASTSCRCYALTGKPVFEEVDGSLQTTGTPYI